MTAPWERQAVRLAWGIGLGSLGLVAASSVLLVLDWKAVDSVVTVQLLYFIQAPIVAILGALIAARRPKNPIGWLLLAIATIGAIYLLADFIAMRGLLSGTSRRGWVDWPAWIYNNTGTLGALLLGFIVLFFPDGHLLAGKRWRIAAGLMLVGAVTGVASSMLATTTIQLSPRLPSLPNPVGVPALAGITNPSGPGATVPLFLLLLLCPSGGPGSLPPFPGD